jgi:hypothetical protein
MFMSHHYCLISCRVLWREFSYFASQSRNSIDLVFLKQGLHEKPDNLRTALQETIDKVEGDFEAILLGYGLCSNGIEGITARKTKIVVPRAHDCITFLLGSKERYREYFDSHPGTYWYSPGWIETGSQPGKERYELLLKSYAEKYGEENAEYLMGMEQNWFKTYSNAAFVDLGAGDSAYYKAYTKECAEWLKWKYEELKGRSALIENLLAGHWTDEDFLTVNPGETIIATHDSKILGKR